MLEDGVDAAHVHVRLVETGERGARGVLAWRRRAHHGGHLLEARGERLRQRRAQVVGQRGGEKQAADAQRRVPQFLPAHVGEVLAIELEEDARAQPGGIEVRLIRVGGDGHEGGTVMPARAMRASARALPPTRAATHRRLSPGG